MLRPKPDKIAARFFDLYLNRIVKSDFNSWHILRYPENIDAKIPIILTPNHISWWDGFFAWKLNNLLFHKPFYLLMLEKELKKVRFFQKLGAFSINPDSPKKILETLSFIGDLMNENVFLIYYPQGKITATTSIMIINRGLTKVSCSKPVQILPMFTTIEPLNTRKPNVFFAFGKTIMLEEYKINPELLLSELEECRAFAAQKIESGEYGTLIFGNELVL
jgi:1-acyl-sn-glycerol-3-phosphate acyltransferase